MTSQQDTELEKILYAYRFDTQAINEDLVLQQNPTAVEKQHQEIIAEAIQALTSWKDKEVTITENTSDGYHTFKELYEFRMLYNALLFNEWAAQEKYNVHKSWKHSDGKVAFGGGWFVVVAELPSGQITNHYEEQHWDLFKIPQMESAIAYDGHTAQDVAKRLRESLQSQGGKNVVEN